MDGTKKVPQSNDNDRGTYLYEQHEKKYSSVFFLSFLYIYMLFENNPKTRSINNNYKLVASFD